MGYGDDVRAFMDRLTESPLSAQERCLWERIRWMFDRAGDPKKLPIATFVLMEAEKMTEPTFRRARKKLEKEGLIRVESVKGQAALYELLPIIKDTLREPSTEPSTEPSFEPSFEPSTEPSGEASREPSEDASGEAAEGHARARDNTYVSGISKNNIIYYNTLSLRNHGGGTGEPEREIPTVEMVEEYAREAGLEVDAEAFVRANTANGWRDSRGAPIMSWRIWLMGYAARMGAKTQAHAVPAAINFEQRRYEQGELEFLFDRARKYDAEEG